MIRATVSRLGSEPVRVDRVIRGSGSGAWFYAYVSDCFDPIRYLVRGESERDAYEWMINDRRVVRSQLIHPNPRDPELIADYARDEFLIVRFGSVVDLRELREMVREDRELADSIAWDALDQRGGVEMNESGELVETESIMLYSVDSVEWFYSEEREQSRPKLYASLWGGASYSWADRPERFESFAEIRREWFALCSGRSERTGLLSPLWGGWDDYPSGSISGGPSEGGPERIRVGLFWFDDPEGESYPSGVIEIGPRGGLYFEPA